MTPSTLTLDLSLTRTGWARRHRDHTTHGVLTSSHGAKQPEQRLDDLGQQIAHLADAAAIVAIEGLSYSSRGSTLDQVHALHWHIRLVLHHAATPTAVVPPAVIKRYGCGRGNADKQAMLAAAIKRLDYTTDRPDDNEVDALWLLALTCDAYGHPTVAVPKAQRDPAVAAVDWPEPRQEAA